MKAPAPAMQPVLEVLEPADVARALVHRVVLEQPALADDLPLLVHHQLDVAGVEALVVGDGLGEGVLGLREGEAQGGLHQLLALLLREVHRAPACSRSTRTMSQRRSASSAKVGSGTSSTEMSFSSSTGITSVGASRIAVV